MATIKIKQAYNFKQLMITVILLLSLTSFSGFNISYTSSNQQKINIELRYFILSVPKKTITFPGSSYPRPKVVFRPEVNSTLALFVYNSSLKTKLNQLYSDTLLFNIHTKFSGIPFVHQYADEDSVLSI